MIVSSYLVRCAAVCAGLMVGMWTLAASAQTVVINESSIQRSKAFRPSSQEPMWINKADCLEDDHIVFPLTVSDYSNYQLEVWVGSGTDCRPPEARRPTTATCWQVWKGVPTSTGVTVSLAARDIVSRRKAADGVVTGPGTGTIEDCEWNEATTAPLAADIYFMFIDTGSEAQVGGTVWQTKFDLAGPSAPSEVTAGVGDKLLTVKWTESTDPDKTGYQFYCDPVPGNKQSTASTSEAIPVRPMNFDSGVGDAGDAEPGELDSSSGAGGGGTTGGCSSQVLIEGQEPNPEYLCGSASLTASSGKITGLENALQYTVAVAAVDHVGNVGKLSNLACAAPHPVDDFFKVYRDSGGKAGGGFCTIRDGVGLGSSLGGSGKWWLLALIAGLGVVRGRRGTRA